uniref:Uncharacterized protein n=1 Tax=Anopheles atroparvus TaxID=41427 RepID=A0A182IZK7_ANOAO
MPSPSVVVFEPGGRGFFRLDRSGVRVTEPDPTVEPFDTVVTVVLTDCMLPFMPEEYGRPEESNATPRVISYPRELSSVCSENRMAAASERPAATAVASSFAITSAA